MGLFKGAVSFDAKYWCCRDSYRVSSDCFIGLRFFHKLIMKRVVCIVGMLDFVSVRHLMWAPIERAFEQYFPDVEVVVEHETYLPWQRQRIADYGERIVQKYDDGVPTLLLGFSLGGVIACGIAQKFMRTPITGVVSVASPLKLAPLWGICLPKAEDVRLLSFSGRYDFVVPSLLTGCHYTLPADHFVSFMTSEKPAWAVAKHVQGWLIEGDLEHYS